MNYTVYSMKELTGENPPNAIEGFVFFSTMEDRSWDVLSQLSNCGKLPEHILSFGLQDEEQSKNYSKAEYADLKFSYVTISKNLATNLIPCLKTLKQYIEDKKCIGVDISVMPTPIFYQILHFLFEHCVDKKIIIYYTEPGHYNLDNLFDFNSCDGEIDIKVIPGFEGKTAQENHSQRVIFYLIGFEMNYLNKLIPQQTNPDGIVPINGFPSYFPKYKDISLVNNNVNYHEEDIQVVYAEANNPFETFNQINILERKYKDFCIDIIPAGSKPMALGACLFALKNGKNDVRVLFPFPCEYKNQNSIGTGKIWEYTL